MKKTSDGKQTKARAARLKQSVRSKNGARKDGRDVTVCAASESTQGNGTAVLQGRIERVSGTVISGWAWDPRHPNKRVRLELVEGETCLTTALAAEDRPDLVPLGCGDGYHGFSLEVADLVSEGQHVLTLRCAGTGATVPGSPIIIARGTAATSPLPILIATRNEAETVVRIHKEPAHGRYGASTAPKPTLFLEISDLFVDMAENQTISGIQRVQLGLVAHLFNEHRSGKVLDCCLVIWRGDAVCRLQDSSFARLLTAYQNTEYSGPSFGGELIEQTVSEAEPVCLTSGDILVSTGTIYGRSDVSPENSSRLR